MIRIRALNLTIQKTVILQNISCKIQQNEKIGIIGLNGSGKSSLLKCIYYHYKHFQGHITIHDHDIKKDLKRHHYFSLVPQQLNNHWQLTVYQFIQSGLLRYQNILYGFRQQYNQNLIRDKLQQFELTEYINTPLHQLSYGQQQRVILLRALCQQNPILILDEPTNHLDMSFQQHLFHHLKKHKGTILITSHDLDFIMNLCDKVLLLYQGKLILFDIPQKVITHNNIQQYFHVNMTNQIINDKSRWLLCY